MTFAGTAPQSTSKATNSAKLSSAIICRVPPMAASFASMGRMARTPTQQDMAGNIPVIARSGKSMMQRNVEATT